jgi:hypothetical protein
MIYYKLFRVINGVLHPLYTRAWGEDLPDWEYHIGKTYHDSHGFYSSKYLYKAFLWLDKYAGHYEYFYEDNEEGIEEEIEIYVTDRDTHNVVLCTIEVNEEDTEDIYNCDDSYGESVSKSFRIIEIVA